ncbi:hypothetical protein cyc_06257 [Cyclospora cayetanensis]|uniref:Uncharacterized protein n=1 Tax=Cyclospora cayetanensis TaxID=88456 RepID=A0A1D3DAZ4_9EIME|nr:hypothetical protein cyc_06257 [Cyclospora cayetanensis]
MLLGNLLMRSLLATADRLQQRQRLRRSKESGSAVQQLRYAEDGASEETAFAVETASVVMPLTFEEAQELVGIAKRLQLESQLPAAIRSLAAAASTPLPPPAASAGASKGHPAAATEAATTTLSSARKERQNKPSGAQESSQKKGETVEISKEASGSVTAALRAAQLAVLGNTLSRLDAATAAATTSEFCSRSRNARSRKHRVLRPLQHVPDCAKARDSMNPTFSPQQEAASCLSTEGSAAGRSLPSGSHEESTRVLRLLSEALKDGPGGSRYVAWVEAAEQNATPASTSVWLEDSDELTFTATESATSKSPRGPFISAVVPCSASPLTAASVPYPSFLLSLLSSLGIYVLPDGFLDGAWRIPSRHVAAFFGVVCSFMGRSGGGRDEATAIP